MAAPVNDSKVLTPFVPSLSLLASVGVAVSLVNEFHFKTLGKVFREIQRKNSKASNQGSKEDQMRYNKAKEKVLCIPAHLRKGVSEAIHGLLTSIEEWRSDFSIKLLPTKGFCARSDGTIDVIRTMQKLVLNKDVNIRKRFELACLYCLEKSVKTLWFEMEASGESINIEIGGNFMTNFWIRRMREESEVPWTQAILENINSLESRPNPLPRFSSFFALIQPKDREKCLIFSTNSSLDDFRFCLNAMTREEEEKILKTVALKVLVLYLQWPLQGLFLQTVEKMWNYLDDISFCRFITHFMNELQKRDSVVQYDYSELFEGFWNRTPNHFREALKKYPNLRPSVDFHLNNIKRKRKLDNDEQTRKKKCVK